MTEFEVNELDWEKTDGLIPAIIQDEATGQVLMLGYMNRESLEKTLKSGNVTFWSRSRKQLWTKGETSGNFLRFRNIRMDCDRDTLLVKALPVGPVCHTGTTTCFEDGKKTVGNEFFSFLEDLIQNRKKQMPTGSYTTALFERGIVQISKKLGEEAVEVIVSAQQSQERTIQETADLLYHLLVFLSAREINLSQVIAELASRHGINPKTEPGK